MFLPLVGVRSSCCWPDRDLDVVGRERKAWAITKKREVGEIGRRCDLLVTEILNLLDSLEGTTLFVRNLPIRKDLFDLFQVIL